MTSLTRAAERSELRILTVSHFYEAHGGGIERVAGQLCRQFSRLGATSVWIASDSDVPFRDGIEAVPLSCVNPTEKLLGLPMPVPGHRGIRKLAHEVRRADAVVIHDALYATSILAMLFAKMCRKRTILVQHIAAIPFSSTVLRALMTAANCLVTGPMLRFADVRVFISDTVRRELIGEPSRLSYNLLFNGIDSSIFYPSNDVAEDSASEIALPAGSRRILFVGRYVEKKGLAVIRELAAHRPDLTFLLAGSGPIRVREWDLTNVHDLGPLRQEQLAELYRRADLLLLPSVGEGYPLVIQEGMACGLPVICGTPSDRADPDASRWLCGVAIELDNPKGSARRCSEAIDQFSLDDQARRAMSAYASCRYDWTEMARAILQLASQRP